MTQFWLDLNRGRKFEIFNCHKHVQAGTGFMKGQG